MRPQRLKGNNMHKTALSPELPQTNRQYRKLRTFLVSALLAPVAGLIASLVAVMVMGILYFTVGAPTPVALFSDFVLKHINVNTFIRLLLTFGNNSKKGPLGLALLGMIGAGTVLSWLYALLVRVSLPTPSTRPTRWEWLTALSFAVGMTLIATLLFWNELRQNQLGLPINWAILVTILSL